MSRLLLLSFLAFTFTTCSVEPEVTANENQTPVTELPLQTGAWRMVMQITEAERLPVDLNLAHDGSAYTLEVINDQERIEVTDLQLRGDSIFIRMPFFDSEFAGVLHSDSSFSGHWHNFSKGPAYKIPFTAVHGATSRFRTNEGDQGFVVAPKWEVYFSPETEDPCIAIGTFKQDGTHLSGTFITETGDYRYLDGIAVNDSIYLSCFDGAHAFLFKAALDENQQLNGQFWSGSHWNESWTATANPDFELRNPDSLTFLKEGYDKFEFSFPNLDGEQVSLSDEKYKNKVVVVQIMGSWCPNCMDETMLYRDLYDQHHASGLEIVSLAYEMHEDFDKASTNVKRLKNELNANYDFLVAGVASKKRAAETLPMLNHVMSYPTSIFIDRQGTIRRIHTGFYGPGTGDIYDAYVSELTSFLEELLAE